MAREDASATAPGYRLAAEKQDGLLLIVITGTANRDNADQIAREVMAMAAKSGAGRILIDSRQVKGRLNAGTAYYHVHNIRTFSTGIKTAVLDLKENEQSYKFFETVMVNVGFQTRFFSDEAEARKWLAD